MTRRLRSRPLILSTALAALAGVLALLTAGCGGAPEGDGGQGSGTVGAPTPVVKVTKKPRATKPTSASRPTSTSATRIVFVDVGQGDAAIIRSGAWTGLIDGGPSGSAAPIERALRRLGASRLNAVVVSHPHADHTGGLPGVVYDYRPKRAYVGEGAGGAASALRAVGARVTRVRRGTTLRFGSLRARVLSPGSLSGDANEDSVVLLLEAGRKRFLFTGDCTGPNESIVDRICARGPPLYLLKVAHHGSNSSTSPAFLADTDPRFAILDVGPNSYGHPTPQTISALRAEGTRTYSTQRNGTITLTISAAGAVSWTFARSSRPVTGAARSSGLP